MNLAPGKWIQTGHWWKLETPGVDAISLGVRQSYQIISHGHAMAGNPEWYIIKGGKTYGAFTSAQLVELARTGKINPDSTVRKGSEGKSVPAGSVRGLFDKSPQEVSVSTRPSTPPSQEVVARQIDPDNSRVIVPAAVVPNSTTSSTDDEWFNDSDEPPKTSRLCPFCGEVIAQTAIKCRFCNEFLDGRSPEPIKTIHVHESRHAPLWSPGVAIVLSFLIPGLGQMYKGQILNGLCWLVFTIVGYAAFVIPGLILHLCCIVGAGRGNPNRA